MVGSGGRPERGSAMQARAKAQQFKQSAFVCSAQDSSAFPSALQPAAACQLRIGGAPHLLLELGVQASHSWCWSLPRATVRLGAGLCQQLCLTRQLSLQHGVVGLLRRV